MSTCSVTPNLHYALVLSKRIKLTVAFVVGVTLCWGFIALRSRDDEPRYQGKLLSEWYGVYGRQPVPPRFTFQESAAAIRAIGTNALPTYLKWLRHEPSRWRQVARGYLPRPLWENATFQGVIGNSDSEKTVWAEMGMAALGTNAAAAIPELKIMMLDRTAPRSSLRAVSVLQNLGAGAIPVLREALEDTNTPNRFWIVHAFSAMARKVGTNAVLPHLRAALTNDDPLVRTGCTNVIQEIAPEVLTNAPAQ